MKTEEIYCLFNVLTWNSVGDKIGRKLQNANNEAMQLQLHKPFQLVSHSVWYSKINHFHGVFPFHLSC